MTIRPERPDDEEAIGRVTELAFRSHPHSEQTEQFIVEALRKAEALTVSLVAERDGDVVGHVAFSPVWISDGSPDWYGLGPVSVVPEHQRQGIGRELIESGLTALQALGAAGCVVVGEPGYYSRFGFARRSELTYSGVPPEYFQALAFEPLFAQGNVTYHDAFGARG